MQHRFARRINPNTRIKDRRFAHHGCTHLFYAHLGNSSAGDIFAVAQDRHVIGKSCHLAEFMRDHEHSQRARVRHRADMAQNLIRFGWGQHRRRLVQDQKPVAKVKLFDDLKLLLFACGKLVHRTVERNAEWHGRHESLKRLMFLRPVDDAWRVGPTDHEVFGAGKRGN